MITLAAADSLQGKAGTGAAISCTLLGLELSSTGVESYKVLARVQLGTGAAVLYTVPASTTAFIKEIHLANTTGAAVAGVVLYTGGSAAVNQLVSLTIPANGEAFFGSDGWKVYDVNGALLQTVVTSTPDATFTASGLETAAEKLRLNAISGRTSTGTSPRIFRPAEFMVGNTYDPTGAADSTSSFAAMMTAYNAFADRAVIELPPGVFKVAAATLAGFPAAPGRITGAGRGVCVLVPTGSTGDMVALSSSVDGFAVDNFAIYQTGTPNTAGSAINTNGADSVTISNMLFVNQFVDVNVNSSSIKVSIQQTLHSQTNGSATSVGILVSNGAAGDTYIGPDVVMSNTGATRRRASVEIAESGHYEVTQANLTGAAQGILIDPAAGKIVAFGFHTNVLCDSCTANGMTLNAATATSTIKNIKSVNSWYSGTISGGGAGVVTTGAAGGIINGVTFTTDRFLNNQTHGFQHGFGTDFRWSDCDMKGNSAALANTSDGLNVAAGVSNWSINGGKYGGSDTAITGNQRYGIFVAPGAGDNIKIGPDDLTGNSTGPLSQQATGNNVFVTSCPGLAPGYTRKASSAALAATQTTLANTLLPKNSANVGTTLIVTASFQQSSTGVATFQIRAGATNDAVGSSATNAVVVGAVTAAAVANAWGTVTFTITFTAIGAAANLQGSGSGIQAAAAYSTPTAGRASGAGFLALDTTADRFLTLSVATTVGTITCHNAQIVVSAY